jgi:transcriptional regulator with XRE-family HTH domain
MFADRIRELKKSRNISQSSLAAVAKITERQFRNLEIGKNEPSLKVLIALADHFDVSIDYLVGRSDDLGKRVAQKMEAETESVAPNARLLALLKIWDGATPEEKDKMFRALSEEEQEDVERQVAG